MKKIKEDITFRPKRRKPGNSSREIWGFKKKQWDSARFWFFPLTTEMIFNKRQTICLKIFKPNLRMLRISITFLLGGGRGYWHFQCQLLVKEIERYVKTYFCKVRELVYQCLIMILYICWHFYRCEVSNYFHFFQISLKRKYFNIKIDSYKC